MTRDVDGVARFDFEHLGEIVRTAVTYLDRVIDITFSPTPEAAKSNERWRPVGLGAMGLADVFFQLRLPFDSEEARELSARIQEVIYLNALRTSCDLAEEHGPHSAYDETWAAEGRLQPDLWGVTPSAEQEWVELREKLRAQ